MLWMGSSTPPERVVRKVEVARADARNHCCRQLLPRLCTEPHCRFRLHGKQWEGCRVSSTGQGACAAAETIPGLPTVTRKHRHAPRKEDLRAWRNWCSGASIIDT